MKTIITVSGIRPDFIRMSYIFKKLDKHFNHILVHTGQHYDTNLSNIFFSQLKLRKPDYNLKIGAKNKEHYHQLSILAVKFIDLLRRKKIKPDLIIFLGDSNSVGLSFYLKKEGYRIAHIEAGMRSYDDRMLEEINRIVCDHCSDLLFVYHTDYKKNLIKENINSKKIFIVGNTIVEPCKSFLKKIKNCKKKPFILVDIHRPENFKYKKRLKNIFKFLFFVKKNFDNQQILLIGFKRTLQFIKKFNINTKGVSIIPPVGYLEFLELQKQSIFIVSDSGTAQEEPAIFDIPVIVPRDYSERLQSYLYNCSFKIDVNSENVTWKKSITWLNKIKSGKIRSNKDWLGDGNTSNKIISILKKEL